ELLFWSCILGIENPIPFQVHFCVREDRLIPFFLPLRLQKLRLEGTRIDFGDDVAGSNHLPFLNGNAEEFSIDTRSHGDRVESRRRSEPVQINRKITGSCFCRNNRHRRRRRSGCVCGLFLREEMDEDRSSNYEKNEDSKVSPPETAIPIGLKRTRSLRVVGFPCHD